MNIITIQNQFTNEQENLVAVSFLSKKGLRYAIIQNEQVINIISCNVFKNEGYKQTILTYTVEQLQPLINPTRWQMMQELEQYKQRGNYKPIKF